MKNTTVNLFLLAGVVCLHCAHCIVSEGKKNEASEKSDQNKSDNVASQSVDRDYFVGYDENYGHGGYGLSAHGGHGGYGFPEGHDSYGLVESNKHHIHHADHYHDHHKHYDPHHKALAIKSLLVPLAGVALLGAAAAFVSNPILLQLGVISASGSTIGRKKRSLISNSFKAAMTREDEIKLNEIKILEKFVAQMPDQDIETQEKRMLANYLSCSGLMMKNFCLERLVCSLYSAEGNSMPVEANVLTIIVNEILDNSFVPEETKIRLSKAVDQGRGNFGCEVYECRELEKLKDDAVRITN